jgi:hypothetical protein
MTSLVLFNCLVKKLYPRGEYITIATLSSLYISKSLTSKDLIFSVNVNEHVRQDAQLGSGHWATSSQPNPSQNQLSTTQPWSRPSITSSQSPLLLRNKSWQVPRDVQRDNIDLQKVNLDTQIEGRNKNFTSITQNTCFWLYLHLFISSWYTPNSSSNTSIPT